jgi:hypothetical protein
MNSRFVFYSETDVQLGKVPKYQKPNPVGEDMYLRPDGTIESDEAKIVRAQQIFKHNYYKPGGAWELKTRKKYPGAKKRVVSGSE